jgi:hypothetical protein
MPRCRRRDKVLKIFTGETFFIEMPANPHHESSFEHHENIPEWYAEREAKTHAVLGFDEEWRVAVDSRGEISAWKNRDERDVSEAPSTLRWV